MSEWAVRIVTLIVPLVFAIVCHEVAHGWVARMLGDRTAHDARRLSLNPFRHVDPVGTVLLPGALALLKLPVFGWAKPVPVDARQLRNPRVGMMLVAAAGPLTNLLPEPPFDGSHLVEGLLPRRAAAVYERSRRFALPLMLVLLVVVPRIAPHAGIVSNLVLPPVLWMGTRYHELAGWIAAL